MPREAREQYNESSETLMRISVTGPAAEKLLHDYAPANDMLTKLEQETKAAGRGRWAQTGPAPRHLGQRVVTRARSTVRMLVVDSFLEVALGHAGHRHDLCNDRITDGTPRTFDSRSAGAHQ